MPVLTQSQQQALVAGMAQTTTECCCDPPPEDCSTVCAATGRQMIPNRVDTQFTKLADFVGNPEGHERPPSPNLVSIPLHNISTCVWFGYALYDITADYTSISSAAVAAVRLCAARVTGTFLATVDGDCYLRPDLTGHPAWRVGLGQQDFLIQADGTVLNDYPNIPGGTATLAEVVASLISHGDLTYDGLFCAADCVASDGPRWFGLGFYLNDGSSGAVANYFPTATVYFS